MLFHMEQIRHSGSEETCIRQFTILKVTIKNKKMTIQEQKFWDKCFIAFSAALLTKPQDFILQSSENCIYEGKNMADFALMERQTHLDRCKPKDTIGSLGVLCHECKAEIATEYYGMNNTYPSCQNCIEKLDRQFDNEYQ